MRAGLATKELEHVFKLEPNLADDLLTLADIGACLVTHEPLPGAANCESFLVQQASNLSNDEHVLALIVTPITASLDRFELWEFLLPITQHVWLYATQVTDLTYREVAFARYRWELGIISGFQHTLLLAPLIFDPAETSRPAEP